MFKKFRPTRPSAMSLVFALVIMSIIVITSATMSASFLRASQRNADLFRSTQAYYAARSSMEKAIASVAQNGIGYEDSATGSIALDTNGDAVNDTNGDYDIYARAKPLDWQSASPSNCGSTTNCYVPMPGTGTAGSDCDFEDASQPWAADEDDSCNWNKIGYQENVTIPLYYSDASCTDGVCNPKETGITNFILKIKTPNGEVLEGDSDTIIVNWEISGTCDDGISNYECYMIPAIPDAPGEPDTQLNAYKLNDSVSIDYELLNGLYDVGKDDLDQKNIILDFLTADYLGREILNPSLKLSVISPLIEFGGGSIPYLEYQMVVDKPISDTKVLYVSEGKSEGKLGNYVQHIRASQGIGSSAIINFAIQN
ncbi:MAG: hypothetical protein ACD_28C00232G0003 [uncultured bacterium]|nr:MAG: hypothetical protein ACD_28C00232G0003 [uncultured bacterium]KKT74707.1 MAG: hypothetical protein UW70_C0047G0008 [Candidatus Peregrinibacteria bacterium GW2011_GWA2_44_7]